VAIALGLALDLGAESANHTPKTNHSAGGYPVLEAAEKGSNEQEKIPYRA
jgi:hypothetical protein